MRSLLLAAVGTLRWGAVTTSLTPSTWLARPSPSLSDLRATASRRDCLVRWRSCVCLLANLSRREECLGHGNAEADSEVALDSDRSTREGEWGHDLVFAMAGWWVFAVSSIFLCLALALLVNTPSCTIGILPSFNTRPLKLSASLLASEMTQGVICLGG